LEHSRACASSPAASVDDGKSTLIGRLLVDSKSVLQDQLAGVQRAGETDLALLTDGLSAEREQGITIDVAYRYFATPGRKFIIGDAPGHEQYTRNMVTPPSSADAAVVLVDATKLDWQNPLPGTAAANPPPFAAGQSAARALHRVCREQARRRGRTALAFATSARRCRPLPPPRASSARHRPRSRHCKGFNVVDADPGWCGYQRPTLLALLEHLPDTPADTTEAFAFPVQWVEKFSSSSSDTTQGRRVFWGRVATGACKPGQAVKVMPSGQTARVAQVLDHVRQPGRAGRPQRRHRAGPRGGCVARRLAAGRRRRARRNIRATPAQHPEIRATVAWMDDEPLVAGRAYWALHGHRWVKAKVQRIVHRLDMNTLAEVDADQLPPNAIGHVELALQEPLAVLPYARSRVLGSLVLVDTATHKTSGAALVR
jgi:sulfate adenylyltransferase subunit 1